MRTGKFHWDLKYRHGSGPPTLEVRWRIKGIEQDSIETILVFPVILLELR